jgi:adenylate kinase
MYSQKKMFDDAMQKAKRDFVVFELVLSEEEAIKRLENRSICPSCGATYSTIVHGTITHCPLDNTVLQIRDDDRSEQAIRERFRLFYQDTKPGLEDYKKE